MKIVLNGEEKAVPDNINIEDLFALLKFDPFRSAVELNGNILKTDDWETSLLKENDKVEVISFVGGG